MNNETITGATYIAQCLHQQGVTKVFGQCGHTNYALIDACHRLGIEYISFRHEQQAAHAADAYYRVSHELAVLNLHLSPGLTNALTGIATAAADGTPMVVIAGNTPSYHHAREAHQSIRLHADASQGDIFRPICKRVWRVDDVDWLPDVMPRALNLAMTGRSGAVLIDVPMDIFSARLNAVPAVLARRATYVHSAGAAEGLERIVQALRDAQRPVIYAGNGVALAQAEPELGELAHALRIPVATTLAGKGVFPEDDPLSLGTTGIWGTALANETTRDADVILAVGTAFAEADCSSWRPEYTFAIPPTRLYQIDIDPQEIGKIYAVECGIVGDAKASLAEMVRLARGTPVDETLAAARRAPIETRRRSWLASLEEAQNDAGKPIHPARLLHELGRAAPHDAVFVTDVGWNKNGAGQQLPARSPRSFITSGGMATMGFSPAAAIGAKLGAPHRKVIGLVGDGGLLSVVGALATAVELNIPVLWVLFNNFCYSTIRTVGSTYFSNTYGTEFTRPDGTPYNPDFMLLARSFGIESMRIEEPGELAKGLEAALARDVPLLLEVVTRGDLPMPRTGYWDIADFLAGGNVVD